MKRNGAAADGPKRAVRLLMAAVFFSERITGLTARHDESPGFCKAEDLANLFALPVQGVNQLTRDGVLKKRDTPAGKRYNVVESTRSYVQHLRDLVNSHGDKDALEAQKLEAEVRLMQAKAQIAETEAQQFRGWPI